MLELKIPITPEMWDEVKEEFIPPVIQTLQLEHSLVSLKAWESKWCKPFLSKEDKTAEETLDYIKHMTITPNVDPDIYNFLTEENVTQINDYIMAPMTATTFRKEPNSGSSKEIVTAELMYYWMFSFGIPMECENWHLNSLLTLIRVFNVKNTPHKKKSVQERLSDNARINAERRKLYNSKG